MKSLLSLLALAEAFRAQNLDREARALNEPARGARIDAEAP